MNFLTGIEKKLNSFYVKLSGSRKGTLLTALITYTVLFLTISGVLIFPIIHEKGHILGGDGLAQYHPLLLDFRRNMISFFESVKNGNPDFRMLNPKYIYGFDSFIISFMYFFPFLPVYIFVIFVKEESTLLFFSYAIMVISYFCGISFIAMCRHFGIKNAYSGIFAVTYIFCGNYFATGLWNPQFLCMYFIFPVLIIGLDKILNDQSGIIFALSVAFLSPGITFLIYTIPFVFIFAVSRVYFSPKRPFIKNILKYFIRCMIYGMAGICIAAFHILPSIYFLANSGREVSQFPELSELLIPSIENIVNTFFYTNINGNTMINAASFPFIIFLISASAVKKEHKINLLIMLLLISVPGVWYGVNMFQYTICRWGFIPACLFSYYSCVYAEKIRSVSRPDLTVFIFTSIVCIVLYTIKLYFIASLTAVFICILSVLMSYRKEKDTFSDKLHYVIQRTGKYYMKTKDSPDTVKRISLLILLSVIFLSVLLATVAVIQADHYIISLPFIVSVSAVSIILLISVKKIKKHKSIISSLIFTAVALSAALSFITNRESIFSPEFTPDADLYVLRSYEDKEDGITRFANINAETENTVYSSYDKVMEDQKQSAVQNKNTDSDKINSANQYINAGLRYNFSSAEAFHSMIDSDFISFFKRCGADVNILSNKVRISDYCGWEPVYSMFGIKYMYSSYDEQRSLFGISEYDHPSSKLNIYQNEFSLPLGSTYDTLSDKNTFLNYNSAELPFAMINSVYLENDDSACTSESHYSQEISYEIEKSLRGYNNFGRASYDNVIHLNETTGKGFTFLMFDDVDFLTMKNFKIVDIKIGINDDEVRSFSISNSLNDWQWALILDKYTFPLGYHDEPVSEIKLITPFEYSKMSVIFVPEENYTPVCEKRNTEKLENIIVENNTVYGDLTVSSDKVMVLSMIHNNGWKAFIDGTETRIYKANDLFMGIKVPEGSHKIRFEYTTPYLIPGLIISGMSLLILLLIIIRSVKKQRSK